MPHGRERLGGPPDQVGHLPVPDLDHPQHPVTPANHIDGEERAADALGGVVNLVTKTGEGPPRFTGMLEGGSFDTFNQSASARGSISRFNYSFNVAHSRIDNTPVTPLDLLPPGRKRINDSYENTTLSTKLGADLTNAFGVDVVARYTDSTLFFTGEDFSSFPSVPAARQSEQNAKQVFTRGQAHLALFDGRFNNTVGLAYTYYRTEIQAPDTGFGTPPPNISSVSPAWRSWAAASTT